MQHRKAWATAQAFLVVSFTAGIGRAAPASAEAGFVDFSTADRVGAGRGLGDVAAISRSWR